MVSAFRPLASTIKVGSPDLATPYRAGHGLGIGSCWRALSKIARVAGGAGAPVAVTGKVSSNLPSSGMQTSSHTSQLASAESLKLPEALAGGVMRTSRVASSLKP